MKGALNELGISEVRRLTSPRPVKPLSGRDYVDFTPRQAVGVSVCLLEINPIRAGDPEPIGAPRRC